LKLSFVDCLAFAARTSAADAHSCACLPIPLQAHAARATRMRSTKALDHIRSSHWHPMLIN